VPDEQAIPVKKEDLKRRKEFTMDASGDPERFWKQIDAISARELVTTATSAFAAVIPYLRAVKALQRVTVLLGANVPHEYELNVEASYQTCVDQFRQTKQVFSSFVERIDESSKARIAELLDAGILKDAATSTRQKCIWALVDTDLSANQAQKELASLNEDVKVVTSLTSWPEVVAYFDQCLDISPPVGEVEHPLDWGINWRAICLILLSASGGLMALVVLAFFLAVISLGALTFDEIFTALVDQSCAAHGL
jgi:hypothetical protein